MKRSYSAHEGHGKATSISIKALDPFLICFAANLFAHPLAVSRLWSEAEEPTEESMELHHVEGAFIETLLSKAKVPPQDILQKLEKELAFKEKAEESSLFVYKLGLANLKCCLLMNGLVYEATEVQLFLLLGYVHMRPAS
ncbi:hypothetical protein ACLOJK_023399 [Asimina triloba]